MHSDIECPFSDISNSSRVWWMEGAGGSAVITVESLYPLLPDASSRCLFQGCSSLPLFSTSCPSQLLFSSTSSMPM